MKVCEMSNWKRPRAIARIALGICPNCGERDAAPGGKLCVECKDRWNTRRRAKWAQGEYEGIRTRRITYQRHHKRLVREKRQSEGLCIQCRSPVIKFQRCNGCRKQASEAKKRWRLKKQQPAEFAKNFPVTVATPAPEPKADRTERLKGECGDWTARYDALYRDTSTKPFDLRPYGRRAA